MDVLSYNRKAWDRLVDQKGRWTQPVSSADVAKARKDDWRIVLTPTKAIPRQWFPPLKESRVLCLAAGGGQQGPILAAAGAQVTVFDNSTKQLEQDRLVADRESLELKTVQGDMADLSAFADATFDLIVHPCSNNFVEDILPIWKEAYRVLANAGSLLSGFHKPVCGAFDPELAKKKVFQLRFKVPNSDLDLTEEERIRFFGKDSPIEFVHSLEDQIGGQINAGFQIAGIYEDGWGGSEPIDYYMKSFVATRALKQVL